MEYAFLDGTGIRVSRIALGTWAIGGWLWGGSDASDAIRAIHEALDLGITTIDTAPVYGFGLSEELVARALRERHVPRDRVIIATKCGLEWDETGNVWKNASPARVRKEIEDSLRRLSTDYIDIYQLHWPDPKTPIAETAAVFDSLQREGKVRAVGVSNFGVEQMDEWRRVAPLHSNQPSYSLLDRGIEQAVLPYCRRENIAVLAYSPLARGLLTGKIDESAGFPPGDSRAEEPRFQGDNLRRNVLKVRQLEQLAAGVGKTVAQLAVRWVLDQPGVTVAIWGARRPGQILEAAGVPGWHLTPELLRRIDDVME